ncbi:Helix-turn-helix domain-containing protein [Mucilaginibacter mallensis]|uniref:Helix-turn-helix domain-containing protein n=1 Tax=Mucilaginibacter mallensis TaxID=652787 RepID=A0A1H2CCG1_MUCMA|nr:response regulator transcription factor [Mucilaginibacter mallensis]SDT68210.1 Helix-turn-helix domain-containing protein [Mucilaginibacter mallensis]
MSQPTPLHIKTISEYHRILGLPKPLHPLVSLVRFEDMPFKPKQAPRAIVHNFYSVALKKSFHAILKYGQQEVDFDEGILLFMAPMQVLSIEGPFETAASHQGWLLLVHPDLLWNTPLAKKIRHYEYFDYKANEALHVSDAEEQILISIMQNIANEYKARIDNFSQDVIIAQLELLFTYADRFYQRQFLTRKVSNHQIVSRLEELLNDYFKSNKLPSEGMPPVTYFADKLHLSPNYLSRLLKTLTGQSTKDFIISKVLDLAKEKLSTTNLTMNEIAYGLGFDHPQTFNKLFKSKTGSSPLKFRQSFN